MANTSWLGFRGRQVRSRAARARAPPPPPMAAHPPPCQNVASWLVAGGIAYWLWVRPMRKQAGEQEIANRLAAELAAERAAQQQQQQQQDDR